MGKLIKTGAATTKKYFQTKPAETPPTPTADAAKTLLSSGVNPVAPQGKTIGLPNPVTGPIAPAAQSARTVTTLPVIQTLPTVADRRAAREDTAAQKSVVLLPTAAEKKAAREDSYAQGAMLDASGNLEARKLADAKAQRRLDAAQYNRNRRSRMAPYDPETERDWAAMGARAMQEEPTTQFARLNNGAASIGQTFAAAPVVMLDTAKQYLANNEEETGNPERQAAKRRLAQVENQLQYTVNQYNPAYPALVEERDRLRAILEDTKVRTPVSQDSAGSQMMLHAMQTKEDALQGMEGAPRWLAEQGLSIGQNAALLPLGLINPALPLAAMGTIAAADKTFELNQRGVAPGEALVRGLVAGGIEAATEKIPLDNLMDLIKTGGKSALKNLLKQAGVEAGEESLSYVMNYIADKAARDPEAEFSLSELASSAGGGAFSGLVFGGFGTAANRLRQPVSTLPMVERTVQNLPGSPFESAQAVQTQPGNTNPVQTTNAAPAGAVEAAGQNKTASTGETGAYYFDASDTNNSWKDRTYTQGERTFVQSQDRQRMYEVPKQSEIGFEVKDDGTVVLNDDVVSRLEKADYRDFIKAYADLNLISKYGQDAITIVDQKPITVKSTGDTILITQNGINDVAKKIRGAGLKNQDNVSSILLLDKLIENAVPDSKSQNVHRSDLNPFTYYKGKFQIGERAYDVTLHIKNVPEGDRYYYHTLDKIEVGPAYGNPTNGGTYQETGPTLSAPIIADSSAKGNTQYAQNSGGQTGDDGVGAANAGFAGDYNRLQNQSERFHPEGEKAARPVDVPVEDFQGRSIPKSAATVLEAGATPDSAVEVIEQAIANGEFSFDRITDEAAQKRARQTVESKGWDAARESFHQQAAGGKAGKHTMALGQLLLNNAMNAGDSRAVIDILTDYATLSTQSAQAMQAQRMLKKLSPEGQLYGIQRSVENLRGELAERYGDKAPDLNIDEALVDQFLQAQDQAGRDAAMEKIYRDIARQVPATWMDKWNAWRYLAMLGNPRTHVRNIVGNAAFAPVRMVKNAIGTALESGVDYLSPNGIQRTKAALNPASAEDRALVQAAFADLANVQEQLLGGGKYSESAMGKIDRYRTIFRTLPLEAVRKANSAAMDVEDTWFSRPAYAGALAGYLKANGITAQALSDGAVDASALDAARAYAVREAQRATYRDSNAFSDFVSGLRYRGKNPVGQAANVVMEGVLPFRKTPANILMRGVEYSPAGLAKGLTYDLAKVHSGEMTAAQAIDNISAGLTGTGLLALGAWLASIGLVSGGGSGDDEQDVMSDLTGGQDYALTVGDRNFTLDWLAPEALPFFVGVELWNAMTDRGADGVQFKDALSAMERITDPMLEMSMLQGLQDAIDNVRYADGGTLPKVVANAAVSYLSQGVPTLFGQLERTSEYRRDTTFVDRASWMPNDMQYTLGRVMNKLPGEFQQIPYVDAWGRQESTGNPAERSFNNFLNPAYTSRENETEADKEIQRLLRAGQSGVVPKRTPQSVEVTYKENPKDAENQKRYLNAEEYVSYATVKGQTSYDLAMDMINSDEYRSMTDEQKAEALKLAYAYAGHVAAEEVTDGKHESEAYVALAQAAKKELGLSEAEYLLLYEQYRGELNKDKVREAYRQGMDPETYLEYASGKSSYNSDGEGGLTIAETAKSIRESGLTKDQQELLWLVSYPEWSEKADKAGVPISDYIAYKAATAGLKKSAEKKAALIDAGLPLSLYDKIG